MTPITVDWATSDPLSVPLVLDTWEKPGFGIRNKVTLYDAYGFFKISPKFTLSK